MNTNLMLMFCKFSHFLNRLALGFGVVLGIVFGVVVCLFCGCFLGYLFIRVPEGGGAMETDG